MLGKTNASNKPPVYFVILGTMPTTSGTWTNYYSFPNGWTDISKIRLLNLEILANDTTWRAGQGRRGTAYSRSFGSISSSGFRVYCDQANDLGQPFQANFMYME